MQRKFVSYTIFKHNVYFNQFLHFPVWDVFKLCEDCNISEPIYRLGFSWGMFYLKIVKRIISNRYFASNNLSWPVFLCFSWERSNATSYTWCTNCTNKTIANLQFTLGQDFNTNSVLRNTPECCNGPSDVASTSWPWQQFNYFEHIVSMI